MLICTKFNFGRGSTCLTRWPNLSPGPCCDALLLRVRDRKRRGRKEIGEGREKIW